MSIDTKRSALLLGAVLTAGAASYFGQPLLDPQDAVPRIIVEVFSLLASVLVVVVTILGEPSLYGGRNHRAIAVQRPNLRARLQRYGWLFFLYLLSILLVAIALLIEAPSGATGAKPTWQVAAEYGYMFTAAFALLVSFTLPVQLLQLQLKQFDEYVNAYRPGNKSEPGD